MPTTPSPGRHIPEARSQPDHQTTCSCRPGENEDHSVDDKIDVADRPAVGPTYHSVVTRGRIPSVRLHSLHQSTAGRLPTRPRPANSPRRRCRSLFERAGGRRVPRVVAQELPQPGRVVGHDARGAQLERSPVLLLRVQHPHVHLAGAGGSADTAQHNSERQPYVDST